MDIKKLLKELTVAEKCSLVVGKNGWETMNIDRLGIPSIFMADGPHGLRKVVEGKTIAEKSVTAVCYPSMVSIASSFNPKVSYLMGKSIAEEFKANGASLILGPGINIKRHPFCGRNFEYYSEDPYVTTTMAKGFIEGAKSVGIGVCLKHYALNSQESYRMVSNSVADTRAKYEIYYRSFQNLMELNPEMVMCSYNKVDGVYASENINLLKQTLREEFGFQNVIVSDWSAVNNRTKALFATLDLEMPGYVYGINTLIKDFKKGNLPMEVLDASVERILKLVEQFKDQEQIEADLEKHHLISADLARESMVLLKNEEKILPLKETDKVLVLGEMAEQIRYQGGGSSHINSYRIESITEHLLKHQNVDYLKGYHSKESEHDIDLLNEAAEAAPDYDKIVIVCGLTDEYESEGFDRIHLSIPKNQEYLINRIASVNPNIVLVLEIGSPIAMPFIEKVKGVLNCYLGGEALGLAADQILFGIANPSGRLAETFPVTESDVPSSPYFGKGNHDVPYQESIYVGYRYYQSAGQPVLFPFGYGLSYSHFVYGNLQVNKNILKTASQVIQLKVDVTNNSAVDGQEVVQLFFEAKNAKTPRPKRELIAFDKIELKQSETKTVVFKIRLSDLQYYHPKRKEFVTDDGIYHLQICKNARDILVETPIEIQTGKEYTSCIWNTLKSYQAKNGLTFENADFERMIGQPLRPSHMTHQRPFTINNNLEDIQHTFIGKKFNKILLSKVDETITDMPESFKLMVKKGISQQPLRSLVLLSGGQVKMGQMEFLLALINRKFGKALLSLFRKD